MLLQTAGLLSSGGSQITGIAYPLLVLALTGSSVKAGIVTFARLAGMAAAALPAGIAADRWSRRRLMIGAHVLRAVTVGGLGLLVVSGRVVFWIIPAVALVEGTGAALYSTAHAGAMRSVGPAHQLPDASAAVTGREAAVGLASPALGGALFSVSRALPFLVHAVSYAFASIALLAMRTPFQERRDPDESSLRDRLAEGFRFLWRQPFLRTCALLFGLANFIGPGVLLAVVVIGDEQGLTGGQVGLLVSAFGACLLLGAFLATFVRRLLPVRAVLLLELWTWVGCGLFVLWPSVYVLAASILPTALAIPSTDSVVEGFQLAITPDRLIGRVASVRTSIALLIAPLGPLAAGVLLDVTTQRAAIAVFAGFGLVLAVWGTLSRPIRTAPSLQEMIDARARETVAPAG